MVCRYALAATVVMTAAADETEQPRGENKIMAESAKAAGKQKSTNHLVDETSPYLLQHAHNPVDWYPWSDEALKKARDEDKPIFLSIGYAACHWCHVMENESFENEEIASLLNENFVAIKVDREERPDIDQIYMSATMAMTGSGGWPMSVFLTPDLRPFFAGTYFPPEDGLGRPGFKPLIKEIAAAYRNDRSRLENFSRSLVDALQKNSCNEESAGELNETIIHNALDNLLAHHDRVNGGFGSAPKFPHPFELSFLMKKYVTEKRRDLLEAAIHSLRSMARGGIYDQLGGGFHRYSVDARWLVPHFEKMLYDSALLTVAYAEACKSTGDPLFSRITRETLDFMLSEMKNKDGGFYSSLDADSDGGEGAYYVWTYDEISGILDDKAENFTKYFNVSRMGNFENGTSILNLDASSDSLRGRFQDGPDQFDQDMEESRKLLLDARNNRNRPATDDKILTSWNGLALSALAAGYQVTRDERYRKAAVETAEFLRANLYRDKKLFHSFRDGRVSGGPFLEDYAYLIEGLVNLYEIDYDFSWINLAVELAEDGLELFSDDSGHLYLSPDGSADHFIRPRDVFDGALPSPGSIFIRDLLVLARLVGRDEFRQKAAGALAALSGSMTKTPMAMISTIESLDYYLSPEIEIVVVGKDNRRNFLDEIYGRLLPYRLLVVSDQGEEPIPLLEGRHETGETIVYVCRDYVCRIPATSLDEFRKQLEQL